jgi:hypothetical protein
MNGIELNENLPEPYLEKAGRLGIHDRKLREGAPPPSQRYDNGGRMEIERVVDYLQKKVFPKIRS